MCHNLWIIWVSIHLMCNLLFCNSLFDSCSIELSIAWGIFLFSTLPASSTIFKRIFKRLEESTKEIIQRDYLKNENFLSFSSCSRWVDEMRSPEENYLTIIKPPTTALNVMLNKINSIWDFLIWLFDQFAIPTTQSLGSTYSSVL